MKQTNYPLKVVMSLLFFLIIFSSQAQVRVVGYLPTWMNFPNSVNSVDLTKITHINIAFANPNSSGSLTGVSSGDISTVVNAAHAKNVKVLMSIGGAGAPSGTYHSLLSNSTNMTNFVNNLVNYAVNNNLDGIDVDIEGDVLDGSNVTSSQYQSFVTQLSTSLHAKNKVMTAALATWFGNQVTNTAASKFDWINIMSYDAAIPGTGDAAGQHSPYSQATSDFTYWNSTKGVPGSKLTVGVPFYGYGWGSYAQSGNDEISYASIVNKYAGAENNDVVGSGGNAIYYNGIPTIKKKTTFAIQNASGVMIWELAEDATGAKSLLNAIDQVVKGTVTNPAPTVGITSPANNASFTSPANITINADASDADGISKVEFYNGSTKLGEDATSPYSFAWSNVAAGTYALTAKATDTKGAATTSSAVNVTVSNPVVQSPYGGTVRSIPGTIEAEHYDLGGEGVAYHDLSSGNTGNVFRTDGVDIEATTDAGTGYNVGWVQAGEWLEYTVNVTTAGTYTIQSRVAATAAGKYFHIELDGQNISGQINVPNTGGWQTWQTVTVTTTSLTAGQKVMRIVMDQGDLNLNKVIFTSSIPNNAPTVSITSPAGGASFNEGDAITINADAADSDGSVAKVEFFRGATKIGEDATSPYSVVWTGATAGTYALTAKATDDKGAATTSTSVSITVVAIPNNPPTVSITSPSTGASFTEGNVVTINADAADSDGTIAKVEFFNGATKIGEDATSPYSINWTATPGNISLTAKATDNKGAITTSSAVAITVTALPNNPPTVSITSPAGGASFNAGTAITINANAADSDGSVTKVEFFYGSTKIGEDATSPYSVSWTGATAGTYSLTAKATDNKGASTTSAAVSITVKANTNTCTGVPSYVENSGYVDGSIVQNAGSKYQCKPYPYSGWCNGAAWAYAPGTGTYWTDAWTLVGPCTSARTTSVSETETNMISNVPNPFGNSTTVTVKVEVAGEVSVIVYDQLGREVSVLAKGYMTADTYSFNLDGSNLQTGIYVCKFVSNGKVMSTTLSKQ